MKKLFLIPLLLCVAFAFAQDTMYMYKGGNIVNQQVLADIDSITFYKPIIPPPPVGSNLVTNGDFSNGDTNWGNWTYTGGGRTADFNVVNGVMEITNINGGNTAGWISLVNAPVKLEQGKSYTIKFDARSTTNRSITFGPRLGKDPYTSYASREKMLTTTMQTFSVPYTHTAATDLEAQIIFLLGATNDPVYIDNLSVTEGAPNNGISLKILPIGDSISQGNGDANWGAGTYRRELYFMLTDLGFTIDMVGSMNTMAGANSPFGGNVPTEMTGWDYNHDCYWGYTSAQLETIIGNNISSDPNYNFDVAIIHLGTNDPGDAAIQNLKDLIDLLRTRNPAVVIILQKIISPNFWAIPGMDAVLKSYADKIPLVVAAKNNQSSPVILVDQWDTLTRGEGSKDYVDGLHPSWAGANKMADKIITTIRSAYGL